MENKKLMGMLQKIMKIIFLVIILFIIYTIYTIPLLIIFILAIIARFIGIHDDITETKIVIWFITPIYYFEKIMPKNKRFNRNKINS